jgi:hypothetical protein
MGVAGAVALVGATLGPFVRRGSVPDDVPGPAF